MRFKTDIIHKAKATKEGVFYWCNRAFGPLSEEQLLKKTNWTSKGITCQNCRKYHLYKQ